MAKTKKQVSENKEQTDATEKVQKKPNNNNEEVQKKPNNKIVIRYEHFSNPMFNYAMLVLQRKTYSDFNIRRAIDEKHTIKNYKEIEVLPSVDYYKKYMQDCFVMFRILNIVKEYQKDYIQNQNNITQQFLKKNPVDNGNVMLEEDIPKYEAEINKLRSVVVQLNIEKLSPKYLFMDFDQYVNIYTGILDYIRQTLGETTFYKTSGDGWNYMILYNLFEDYFNIDEVFSWKHSGDIDDFNKRIFFGT